MKPRVKCQAAQIHPDLHEETTFIKQPKQKQLMCKIVESVMSSSPDNLVYSVARESEAYTWEVLRISVNPTPNSTTTKPALQTNRV